MGLVARMAKSQGDIPWQLVRARPPLWTHAVSCVYSKKCLGRISLQKTKPTGVQMETRGHLYVGFYVLCDYQEAKPMACARVKQNGSGDNCLNECTLPSGTQQDGSSGNAQRCKGKKKKKHFEIYCCLNYYSKGQLLLQFHSHT